MEDRKLQVLEGLGYVAALMIAVGGVLDVEKAYYLRYFNILGLVFAIIVIVRLLAMNIAQSQLGRMYDQPSSDDDSDIADMEP